MSDFKASVCVPSYNGARKLPQLLASLEKQTTKAFELLIHLDGSSDGSSDLLQTYQTSTFKLRVSSAANRGRADSRNSLAERADSNLLIFLDDDIRPAEDLVEKHLNHHKLFEESICVGALIDDPNLASNEMQKWKVWMSKKWLPANFTRLDKPYLSAANFSLEKKLFNRLGKFDEKLSDLEDYEFSIRAFDQGVPIYLDPKIIGWHQDEVDFDGYLKRKREYERVHQHLLSKYPLVRQYDNKGYSLKKGGKAWLLRLLSSRFFVNAIRKEQFWIFLIPQKWRYQLIDLCIVALSKQFIDREIGKV